MLLTLIVQQHTALQQHLSTCHAESLHSPEDLVHLRLNDMLPNIEVHHDSQHILDSLQKCLQAYNTREQAPLRLIYIIYINILLTG